MAKRPGPTSPFLGILAWPNVSRAAGKCQRTSSSFESSIRPEAKWDLNPRFFVSLPGHLIASTNIEDLEGNVARVTAPMRSLDKTVSTEVADSGMAQKFDIITSTSGDIQASSV